MTASRRDRCVFVLAVTCSAGGAGFVTAVPVPVFQEPTTPYVRWAVTEPFVSNRPAGAVVVNDKVVVSTDTGEVRAFRCSDGEALWTYQHGGQSAHHLCNDGRRVYFASTDGLIEVGVDTGVALVLARLPCGAGPSLARADKETVYVGGHDGVVYAIDTKTGETRWKSDFLGDAPPDQPNFPGSRARFGNIAARPTALTGDGETLFVTIFDQSRLIAVNATTGERLWSFQADGWIYGAAVTTATRVFVGSQDGYFYCLDKKTGKVLWKSETDRRIESGGVCDQTSVYFGSCDGRLYCLDQLDGRVRWRFATDPGEDGKPSAIYSVPVLRRGVVYFAAGEGQMYAVNRDRGDLRWKIRPSEQSELYCSPATDGTRFFLTTRPRLNKQGEASLVGIELK